MNINTHIHIHTHTLREKGSVDAENVEEDKVHKWSTRSENGEMLSVLISESNKYTKLVNKLGRGFGTISMQIAEYHGNKKIYIITLKTQQRVPV